MALEFDSSVVDIGPSLGGAGSTVLKTAAKPQSLGSKRRTILIAEDNAINQKVIERMVQKLGHQVNLVTNGKEAIEALSSDDYGLIFMDCQMPEMDGFEACREIRRAEKGTRIPIVAITANAMKGDRERCLAAGMDDYVSKPFKQDDLRLVIERWMPAST